MTTAESKSRETFLKLQPGDRVEIDHEVKVGRERWHTQTAGTVQSKERRRHSLHFRRNGDDKVFSDYLLLKREDGELTTITMDEFTVVRKI